MAVILAQNNLSAAVFIRITYQRQLQHVLSRLKERATSLTMLCDTTVKYVCQSCSGHSRQAVASQCTSKTTAWLREKSSKGEEAERIFPRLFAHSCVSIFGVDSHRIHNILTRRLSERSLTIRYTSIGT